MFPVDLMPDWLRIPAHFLPFSYGTSAMAKAVTQQASLADVADELLPPAGFAVVFPVLGIRAFHAIERRVRDRGALDLI